MTKALLKLAALIYMVLLITSCQKELSGDEAAQTSGQELIKGDWKFVSIDVKSTITYTGSLLGTSVKGVTVADFISTNNAGTLKIDTARLILTDLSYSVDTTAKTSTYINNLLVDSSTDPLIYDASPVNTSTDYQFISRDSIHFPNADFINLPADFQLPAITGMKYKVEGDLLKFNTSIGSAGVDNSTGTDLNYTIKAALVITFRKQ